MIRRVYPKLIATNIVSVQPMTQPVGGAAFYRPRYGSVPSIGKDILFKVDTIERLLWLLGQAAEDHTTNALGDPWNVKKWLVGFSADADRCVEFYDGWFAVINGLGRVEESADHSVPEIDEFHEEFLLGLYWQSAFGWPTEMHIMAMAAHDGVEMFDWKVTE